MTDIEIAVQAERERCAKIVEELVDEAEVNHEGSAPIKYYQSLVDRIRNP